MRRDVPIGYHIIRESGSPERMHITPTHEIGDGAAIVTAAIAGLGIAQMPLSLVAEAVQHGRLIEVLPTYATARINIYALWPETRHLLARVRYVVERLASKGQQGQL